MMRIEFVWSAAKADSNRKKHGVSFEEASSVFYDENALLIRDDMHSVGEERFIILGRSSKGNILIVVHLYWEAEEVVRIVSARNATRTEMNQYFSR
ncbi:BrnT family toxin [Bdellovibrio bacteriovorus]|uniref:BrnT family toxin n=1 Tax=Bdellovibrio bacteriovorus TaxID=959 RepID=UPI0039775DE4